jgi:hypothetical protein
VANTKSCRVCDAQHLQYASCLYVATSQNIKTLPAVKLGIVAFQFFAPDTSRNPHTSSWITGIYILPCILLELFGPPIAEEICMHVKWWCISLSLDWRQEWLVENLPYRTLLAENDTTSAVTAEKKVASNLSVFLQRNTTKVRRNWTPGSKLNSLWITKNVSKKIKY